MPTPEPTDRLIESDCELTSYEDLASVLENLPLILREVRRWRRISIRSAAPEIGVSHAALSRIEAGTFECSLPSAIAILRWLDRQEAST